MHWDACNISPSHLRCTSLIHRNVYLENQLTNMIPHLCSNRSLVHGRPESGRAEQGLQRSYRRAGASHRQTQTQVWKLRLHCLPSNRFKGLTLFCCRVLTAPYIMTFKVSWLCFTCIFGPMRHSGTYLMCNIEVYFHEECNRFYFNQITHSSRTWIWVSVSVCSIDFCWHFCGLYGKGYFSSIIMSDYLRVKCALW